MKLKTKFIIITVLALFAVLIGVSSVKAASYTYNYDYGEGEGEKGTITITTNENKIIEKDSGKNTIIEYENLGEIIGMDESSFIMKQTEINKFINDKEISYTFKQKVDNNVESATVIKWDNDKYEYVDVGKMDIELINNEKWVTYKGVINYEAALDFRGLEVTGSKTKDIATAGCVWSIEYYINGNKDDVKSLSFDFGCKSESIAGNEMNAVGNIVNKRDVRLDDGGAGSEPDGYTWLYPIYNSKGESWGYEASIPTNADLSELFLKVSVTEYQGEKITLSDNKGTLYYEGKGKRSYDNKTIYIYKNALSNLKVEENETPLFNYKLDNGIGIPSYAGIRYKFDSNAKDIVVEVNDNNKNEQNIKDKVGITYWGDAKFDTVEIDKSDIIYSNVEENIDKNSTNYKNRLSLNIIDIYRVSGDYGGKLTLTFNVGEQYNGKYYSIAHRISYWNYEFFEGIIKEGKITITVDSLSPFGIAIYENKLNNQQQTTSPTTTGTTSNKGEKDETPKTGTIDIISYTIPVAVISVCGIILMKRKETK